VVEPFKDGAEVEVHTGHQSVPFELELELGVEAFHQPEVVEVNTGHQFVELSCALTQPQASSTRRPRAMLVFMFCFCVGEC